MDAFGFNFHILKTDKQNAMLRYRRLRTVAKLFRILELCILLIFLSWTSSRLPFILKISGDYFRQLISIIISPLFIFLLSNLIVLTLFTKSGKLTASSKKHDTDLYEQFTRNIEISINLEPENFSSVSESEEEIVHHDKQIIREIDTVSCDSIDEGTLLPDYSKVLRRSQSENLKIEILDKSYGNLRRSETEICRKTESSDREFVDELSNEEFQRTIEAFIAKQLRFHKEEKLAIVPHI